MRLHLPVDVPGRYRQVEQKDEPMHGDHHEHGGETLRNHLWNDPLQTQQEADPKNNNSF